MSVEEKAIKAFIDMSLNRIANPYHFSNVIKSSGPFAAGMLHKVSIGWFLLNEIDYVYGIGDPMVGEMSARIKNEVLDDYSELPEYNPMRGFENSGGDTSRTWESSQPSVPPSFIRKGYAS